MEEDCKEEKRGGEKKKRKNLDNYSVHSKVHFVKITQ
jgi:hypothetical protein